MNMQTLKSYAAVYFTLIPQLLSYAYFPLPETAYDPYIAVAGYLLLISGILINIWSRIVLGTYWGPPGQHNITYQKTLITNGPYAYTRNPIYIGTFLITFGFSLVLHSIFFILPFLLIIYFRIQIVKEEKLLLKYFGKKYFNYLRTVPRFI